MLVCGGSDAAAEAAVWGEHELFYSMHLTVHYIIGIDINVYVFTDKCLYACLALMETAQYLSLMHNLLN